MPRNDRRECPIWMQRLPWIFPNCRKPNRPNRPPFGGHGPHKPPHHDDHHHFGSGHPRPPIKPH